MAIISELTPEEVAQAEGRDPAPKTDIDLAQELKSDANAQFKIGKVEKALDMYSQALALVEVSIAFDGKDESEKDDKKQNTDMNEHNGKKGASGSDLSNGIEEQDAPADSETRSNKYTREEIDKMDPKLVTLVSVLWANRAACFLKLEKLEDCVNACNEALHWDPMHIKSLQRRITANEKIGTWSSLSACVQDLESVISLSGDAATRRQAETDKRRIEPKLQQKQKQETDEVLGKLKDLGNTFLGKFGLSTDNFQFSPNGQGGYSMNFQQ